MTPRMTARITRLTLAVALASALLLVVIAPAVAQRKDEPASLAQQMRAGWQTYIFVSTRMPRRSLVELAREAAAARATLVLRGFDVPTGSPVDFGATQQWIAEIQAECCAKAARTGNPTTTPSWVIDPRLFDRYRVLTAPTFVLAWPGADPERQVARIEGDMALANALKFFAQRARSPAVKSAAAQIYDQAFGGTP